MAEPTLIERLRGEARMWGPQVNLTVLGAALHKLLTEAADALERHSLPGGASGYRLVPEEPTEAMRDAFYSAWIFTKEQMPLVPAYRAMLAASPPPPSVWMDRQALEIAVQNRHGMIVNVKDLSDTWRRVAERLETEKQAVETEREACAKLCEGDFDSEMRGYGDYFASAVRARSTQDKTHPRPEPEETVDGRPVFIPRNGG